MSSEGSHQGEELLDHAPDAGEFFSQGHLSLILVLTAFGTSRFPLGSARLAFVAPFRVRTSGSLPSGGPFILSVTLDPLFDTHRKRTTRLCADQRQRKESQTWHSLPVKTGEEAVQTVGALTRLGHHTLVIGYQIHVVPMVEMRAEEQPEQCAPGELVLSFEG